MLSALRAPEFIPPAAMKAKPHIKLHVSVLPNGVPMYWARNREGHDVHCTSIRTLFMFGKILPEAS